MPFMAQRLRVLRPFGALTAVCNSLEAHHVALKGRSHGREVQKCKHRHVPGAFCARLNVG